MNTQYDNLIKKAAEQYLPWDWLWYKAQLVQESDLDAYAFSPVGAVGIAQFMPKTWEDVQRELEFSASRISPEHSITAGAYYLSKMRKVWSRNRPEQDRRRLAFASYNAGAGNILAAQRISGNKTHWEQISKHLHLVTGGHAAETINYVARIERLREKWQE